MGQADRVSLSVAVDEADEFKINIVEVREPDAQEPDNIGRITRSSSFDDKENAEDQEDHDMSQLRILELEHGARVLQKRHKAKVKGLEDEIARLQRQIVKADCTEHATGDLSTTVSLLKAKLAATEEQRIAGQASLQRMQQMLASTQDNANLANSCLLKKVHAAQKATESALAAEAACQEQYTGSQDQLSIASDQIASLKVRLAACEQYFASINPQQIDTALHDSAGAYDPAGVSCPPTYTAGPAIAEMDPTETYDPASGLRLVSVPEASTALTVWQAAAQPSDNLLAQLSAQQQQHDHELTKMHQQYAQQVAQVQQDHLHQLATLEMQQPQHDTHRRTGVWQQIFGKQPGKHLKLNPESSPLQAALVQQQHEVRLTVTDALQLKHTEELHQVNTQLAAAQQQSAHAVQELHECQHRLDSTDALHMQHILTMAELEQQLNSEKETSSAQFQELQQLQSKLAAADAQTSKDSAEIATLKVQLSDTAKTAHSQEQVLLQWQTKAADAESLQAQTASKMAAIQQQLASSLQTCADQAVQLQQRQTELDASIATHAQDSASITTLQRQLAEAAQAASSISPLQAQLADSQQICTEQTQHLEQLHSEHAASHAQNAASIATLEGQLTAEAVQQAYSQEDLVQKYSMEYDNQRYLLEQAAVTSQNQATETEHTIAALQQQVAELQQASQQQYSTLQEETFMQLQTVTEAEKMLVVLERDATQQTVAVQQHYESQLYDQQSQHSQQLAALQSEHDSQMARLLQQQPAVSCNSSLSGKPCPAALKAVRHSTRLQKVQQTLHQTLQASKAKLALSNSANGELQQQLQAKSMQLERLQSKLEGQTGAAATYKASLKASYGHIAKLKAALGQAHKGHDILKTAFVNESQRREKAKMTTAKLTQEVQAKNKLVKQLQDSRHELGAIANGFKGIVLKLEPVASQGRMMGALLEMLQSSIGLPAASHMLGSPVQQLETLIADYTALRTQMYPDSIPSGSGDHADPTDGLEDDWDIEDPPLTLQ